MVCQSIMSGVKPLCLSAFFSLAAPSIYRKPGYVGVNNYWLKSVVCLLDFHLVVVMLVVLGRKNIRADILYIHA